MANWWEAMPKTEKNVLTAEEQSVKNSHHDERRDGPPPSTSTPKPPGGKRMADKDQVTMNDGRVVEFTSKQKMIKDTVIGSDGVIVTSLDFRNGESRTFTMPAALKDRFAAHGADQKLGDAIAGITVVDDCVMAVDAMIKQLEGLNWSTKREGAGFAGTSILLRALVKMTGKSVEEVKEFLAGKSQAEKLALRSNPKVFPFIEELEKDKTSDIDTDAMLGELA